MPGDVILMGAPCHSRSVDPDDRVECEISGIGRISATGSVIEAPRASARGVGHQLTDSDEVRRVALGCDERAPERSRENLRKTRDRKPGT